MKLTKDKLEEICITLSDRPNLNKPEMVNKQEFIEKAKEWLDMNIIDYIVEGSREGISLEDKKQLIEDFSKAMDEMTKPETKPIIIEDNNPCINYRNMDAGWTCLIYAVRCDGISCKEHCDWYNKSSLYTSK
jgi:hypothetical protein